MPGAPDCVPACVLASAVWLIGVLAAVLPLPLAPPAKDAAEPTIAAPQSPEAEGAWLDLAEVIEAHERADREMVYPPDAVRRGAADTAEEQRTRL